MTETENAKWQGAGALTPLRPSSLYGKKMVYGRSSVLGFSPDTYLRALTGKDFLQFAEEHAYKHYRALVALQRAVESGTRMQTDTRRDVDEVFGFLGTVSAPMSFEAAQQLPEGLTSACRMFRRAFKRSFNRTGRRLLTRLAYYDRVALQLTRTANTQRGAELRQQLLGPTVDFWNGTNTGIAAAPMLLLDTALHHLAWHDLELAATRPGWEPGTLVALSDPAARPMRHWFNKVLARTRCADLQELHLFLAKRGAQRLGRGISHDLLKQWASTARPMPFVAAQSVLGAAMRNAGDSPEAVAFWGAKLLTFLADFLGCFSNTPLKPLEAQAYVHERLKTLEEQLRSPRGSTASCLFLV